MSSASETAQLRQLVIAQLVILGLLATVASVAAALIVVRYDRPLARPGGPRLAQSALQTPMVVPTDRKAIIVVPREGETGPVHLPTGTVLNGGSAVMFGPGEPDAPKLSTAEIQRKVKRLFPWRAEFEGKYAKVFVPDNRLILECSEGDAPFRNWLQELGGNGSWLWRIEVPKLAETGSNSVDDLQLSGRNVIVQTEAGFYALREGQMTWSRPLGQHDKTIGMAVRDGRVFLAYSENDHRPQPTDSAGWKARDAEGPWKKGRLAAVDAGSGRELWVAKLGDQLKYAPVVLANGTIILATRRENGFPERHLVAFSRTGQELWSNADGHKDFGYRQPIAAPDGSFYVTPEEGTTFSNDLLRFDASGKLAWRIPITPCVSDTDGETEPQPFLYTGNDVIIAAMPDYAAKYREDAYLLRLNARTGKERWRYRLDSRPESAPIIDDAGNIYCYTHQQIHALTPQGAPLWQTSTDVVDGKLQLVDGTLFAVGNFIQPYTLQGRRIEDIGVGLSSTLGS